MCDVAYFFALCNYLIIKGCFWPFLRGLLGKTRGLLGKTRSLLGKICSLLVFPSSLLRNGGKSGGENRGGFSAAGPLRRPTS